jgi:hypothetical protein
VVPSGDRSILNPVSLLELSAQFRVIWLLDKAVAMRFVGSVGPVPEGGGRVSAFAVFE